MGTIPWQRVMIGISCVYARCAFIVKDRIGRILEVILGRKLRKFGDRCLFRGGIVQNCSVFSIVAAGRIRAAAILIMPKGRGICLDPTNDVQSPPKIAGSVPSYCLSERFVRRAKYWGFGLLERLEFSCAS